MRRIQIISSVIMFYLVVELGAAEKTSTGEKNLVRLQGNSFCDKNGPFLGLGASYFQAMREIFTRGKGEQRWMHPEYRDYERG